MILIYIVFKLFYKDLILIIFNIDRLKILTKSKTKQNNGINYIEYLNKKQDRFK